MKKSFLMYTDYLEQIEYLTMEQRGLLFTAILSHISEKELPELDATTGTAFNFIKNDLDYNTEKYEKQVEKNRINGQKGGRPKKTQENPKKPNETQNNPTKPNKTQNNPSITQQNPSESQKNPTKPYMIHDYMIHENMIHENMGHEKEEDSIKDACEVVSTSPQTPYQEILEAYNNTCISYPRVKTLSDARKKAIKARCNQYTLDDFKTLFEKAEASAFLKGQNDRNWMASFDWLIKDSSMAKVLDGNYDNRERKPTNKVAQELEEFYRMTAEWAAGSED